MKRFHVQISVCAFEFTLSTISLVLVVVVGEFGSERLVQQIVDSIMRATERSLEQVTGHHPPTPDEDKANPFNKEEGEDTLLMGGSVEPRCKDTPE